VKLLSVKDVAQMLGVSTPTIFRLADAGALPTVVIAQRARKRILRFRPEAVEKFVLGREKRRDK